MSKRVICECPACHTDTVVSTAALIADPLFECPACGAVMEVDVGTPAPPPMMEEEDEPPPQTIPSGRAPAPQGEPTLPSEDEAPRPAPPRQIAKTAPMYVSSPGAHLPPAPPRRAAPAGISTPMVLAIAAVSALAGWIAGSRSGDPLEPVRAYCAEEAGEATAKQMCADLLGE